MTVQSWVRRMCESSHRDHFVVAVKDPIGCRYGVGVSLDGRVKLVQGFRLALDQQEREARITLSMLDKDSKVDDIFTGTLQYGQVTSGDVLLEYSKPYWVLKGPITITLWSC